MEDLEYVPMCLLAYLFIFFWEVSKSFAYFYWVVFLFLTYKSSFYILDIILCQIYVLWVFFLCGLSFTFLVASFNESKLVLVTSLHIYFLSILSRWKSHQDIKFTLLSYCSSIPHSNKLWQLGKYFLKLFKKILPLLIKVFFFFFFVFSDFLPSPASCPL